MKDKQTKPETRFALDLRLTPVESRTETKIDAKNRRAVVVTEL